MRKITLFLTVALMSLALSAPAFGQSATEDAYTGSAGVQEFSGGGGEDDGGSAGDVVSEASISDSSSSVLPFTGLQLALIGLAGISLIGLGVALRRGSRPGAEA